jgi:ankyrin repeat protein/uncharacterized protein YegL
MCRAEFTGDINTIPINYLIAQMVEDAKKAENTEREMIPNPNVTQTSGWSVECVQLERPPTQPQFTKPIYSIDVKCGDSKVISSVKTLALLVVDNSGSMAGNPINQVKNALTNILDITKNISTVQTSVVTYNNRVFYGITDINAIAAGGGTDFNNAFKALAEIIDKYKQSSKYGKCVIIFMTDGEDGSGEKKETMLKMFQTTLANYKEKDNMECVVHTLGFSKSHDFAFLNDIRKCGHVEGTYQYADPNESSDVLYRKTVAMAKTEITSSFVPFEIITPDNAISATLDNGKTSVWASKPLNDTVQIKLHDGSSFLLPVTKKTTCENSYLYKWYSHLIDQIIVELGQINQYTGEDLMLCIELLRTRTKSISKFVRMLLDIDVTNAIQRIDYIMNALIDISKGVKLDQMQLTDMAFKSRYTQQSTNQAQNGGKSTSATSTTTQHIIVTPNEVVELGDNVDAIPPLQPFRRTLKSVTTNSYGNTPLHYSAYRGWLSDIEKMIATNPTEFKSQLNQKNDDGLTPLDCACCYRGVWMTVELLLEQGAELGLSDREMLVVLMGRYYYKTCKALLKYKKLRITENDYLFFQNDTVCAWVKDHVARSPREHSLYIIQNALYDRFDEISLTNVDVNSVPQLFNKPTKAHLIMLQYLIEKNMIDIDQEIILKDGEKSNMLFIAAQNGSLDLLNLVLTQSKNNINYQNSKGTTPVWIACCNQHVDIVGTLLMAGADPNICNYKGDSPIVPATQKGSLTIVNMLVDSGCKINTVNKNGDTVIILCCRNGQSAILHYLLSKAVENETLMKELYTFSTIDGFNPMFAAVELDRVDCIKTLYKFHPSLDYATNDENQILPNAMPLHLAAFYGRLDAFKTLIELGANVDVQTGSGETCLHIAIKHKHANVVRYIMANPHTMMPDHEGHMPAYYAKQAGNEEIYLEFFHNPLIDYLKKQILSQSATAVYDILCKHGNSTGCYDLTEIFNTDFGFNVNLIGLAYMQQNKPLIELIEKSGITNTFWYNMARNNSDDERVKRVIAASLKNFQNKLLLTNTKPTPLTLLDADSDSLLNYRMMNEFNTDVVDVSKALEMVKRSPPITMIMTLLNNLPKMLKQNQNDVETMLTYVRTKNVEMVSNGVVFEPTYMFLIGLYTMNTTISTQVNQAILNYTPMNEWNSFVTNLYNGLKSIAPFTEECYRKMNGYFYVPIGTTFTWSTFGTATSEWGNVTLSKTQTVFIIKSKTGRDISPYSMFPQNKEIMFLPNTTFKVVNYYQNNIIVLGQKNVRQSGYSAREKDIENAIDHKNSLIVELEEV